MSDSERQGFEHRVDFTPAFDRRSKDPKKNYGVHGVEIRFALIGPEGGVTFLIMTNWMLPHVQTEIDSRMLDNRLPYVLHKPTAAEVAYHSKRPQYEGHTPDEGCWITGGRCYANVGFSLGEHAFKALLKGGDDGLWAWLEAQYRAMVERVF